MKRRFLVGFAALLIVAIVSLAVGVYSLPPQFLPESVYQLKFGGMYPASRSVGDGTLTDYGPRAGIDRYVIDLGEVMREQFFLALPMKPLCRPECKGLCPICGANRNRQECGCREEWVDPRLAGLKNLLKR